MLAHAKLQTIVWTADLARAEPFYSQVLGLALKGRSHGALVYDVSGGELRVSPVPTTSPSAHTVLGFQVDDVQAVAGALQAAGLQAERFEGFQHAGDGVWRAPDGTQVVWFRDPDGNLLSAVRYG
ncbi:MAG TPA: VOC family protein [Caulobacteraceae bacterium]|nr:VOC family protein [Caulobacteraceae bacterium]